MAPPDIKKLIISFLVLAVVASTAASFLVNPSVAPVKSGAAMLLQHSSENFSSNAFTNNGFGNVNFNAASLDYVAQSTTSTDNLTQLAADNIASNLIKTNPNGPQNINGQLSILSPSTSSLTDQILSNDVLSSVTAPNWEADVPISQIQVIQNYKKEDVQNYGIVFNNILDKYFNQSGVSNLLSFSDPFLTTTNQNLSRAADMMNQAVSAAINTPAPAPVVPFHKSLLKLLVYEKNVVNEGIVGLSDPLKASLVLSAQEANYASAIQDFSNQLQKIQSLNISLRSGGSSASSPFLSYLLSNLLGMKTAHAQWITFDPSNFAQILYKEIKSMLLQMLKNIIVHAIQNKVLKFIQGSGQPKFIQNWESTFAKSLTQGAAGSIQNQIAPNLCQGFSAQILGQLNQTFGTGLPPSGAGGSCGIERAIPTGKLSDFYNDFNQGGWQAYGLSLLPSNNYYGSLFSANQIAAAAGQITKETAQTKAVANQGYKGVGEGGCQNPKEVSFKYDQNGLSAYNKYSEDLLSQGYTVISGPSCTSEGDCTATFCHKGEFNITALPGVSVARTFDAAGDSSIKLVVSANDIAGLVATIAQSLLNRVLTQTGVAGITGLAPSPPPSQPTPPTLPTTCSPSTQTASVGGTAVFGATGGDGQTYTWSAPNGTPGSGSGPQFSTTYSLYPPGNQDTVSVTGSDNKTSTCLVKVQ